MPHFRIPNFPYRGVVWVLLLTVLSVHAVSAQITLQNAINRAIEHDPWLAGNQLNEQALRETSKGVDTLPDPRLSLSLLNLPSAGFAFAQEPMTQFKVAVRQMFPRGDSLAIKQQQLNYQADQYPHQRDDRKARIVVAISLLWLDAVKADSRIRLIQEDRQLFEQLVDIVKASYASAQGNTRQQDVIRAQLELARLDDRLTAIMSQREGALASLYEWFASPYQLVLNRYFEQPTKLPALPTLPSQLGNEQHIDTMQLVSLLADHPALLAIQQSQKAQAALVTLAQQKYQPQWGVNASYAHRADNQIGQSRADFFSIGVSFDVPLFGTDRQDSEVQATKLKTQAIETDRRLLQQQMLRKMRSLYQQYYHYSARERGFKQSILPQSSEQASAALAAYTNDDGDFSEVMRARIALLNSQVELIEIQHKKYQTQVQFQYFLAAKVNSKRSGEQP